MAGDARATTFVTRATAFIGTASVKVLLDRGHRVLRSAVSVFLSAAVVVHASAEPPASATSPPRGCAPATWRDLHVVLINEAGVAQQTLDAAEAEAGAIWARAGLSLAWTVPPGPSDVAGGRSVVVIVRRALLQSPSVSAGDSRARSHFALGQVRFAEDGRPGTLIEVSFQALTTFVMSGSYAERPIFALPAFTQIRLLGRGLGRVVAHELGHWLMGREHTRQGLMSPTFGVRDLVESTVPPLPRTWTATGSDLPLALYSRCELEASDPAGSVRQ